MGANLDSDRNEHLKRIADELGTVSQELINIRNAIDDLKVGQYGGSTGGIGSLVDELRDLNDVARDIEARGTTPDEVDADAMVEVLRALEDVEIKIKDNG